MSRSHQGRAAPRDGCARRWRAVLAGASQAATIASGRRLTGCNDVQVMSARVLPAENAAQVLLAKVEAQRTAAHELAVRQAWAAFLDFAAVRFDVPDEPNADGLLYQFGIFDFGGGPAFYLDPVRQFARFDDDEYIQVHLEIQFSPSNDLAALGEHSEWWFSDGSIELSDWTQVISRRSEWVILNELIPISVNVYQDGT
ncbi:hypothetical protein [Parafrankia irregularis]|uniref:hypothetical protein n=1 Tax=Parafrankia irregularis TaxID=795642 RepID=UPI0013F4D122|nr:hypothetical protein [Parafrankia irregularis]MBE3202480.1 hypothetical protein [Parafrankia sp. CH37]